MSTRGYGLVRVHIAVLLFGLAGLLGKSISAPPVTIVFARTVCAAAVLWPIVLLTRRYRLPSRRELLAVIAAGIVLAVHWQTFFLSVQLSTVAIALLTYSSFPLFVTFLEPLLFGGRLRVRDVLTALAVLVGLALVVPDLRTGGAAARGAIWGLVSGLTFAVFTLINRRFAPRVAPIVLAAGENSIAALVLIPFLSTHAFDLATRDWALLLFLGLIGTALAHVLFMQGLARVRAHTASVIAALEPVYGIAFAALVLAEIPRALQLVGGAIIVGAAMLASAKRD